MQLEFLFTKQGALLAYNIAQIKEAERHYQQCQELSYTQFYTKEWIGLGKAQQFSQQYMRQYTTETLWENENDDVKRKWQENKLHGNHKIYDTLDSVIEDTK